MTVTVISGVGGNDNRMSPTEIHRNTVLFWTDTDHQEYTVNF